MNKKIGKFKLWHLILIGSALGLGLYLYNRNKPEGPNPEEVIGGTGTGAFGPIDPNTGIPYAFESGEGTSGGLNLGEFLENVGLLREFFEPSPTETITETTSEGPGSTTGQGKGKNKSGQHKHTQKPNSTGAAAHAPHHHHAPKHPAQRIGVGPGKAIAGPGAHKKKRNKRRNKRRNERRTLKHMGGMGEPSQDAAGNEIRARERAASHAATHGRAPRHRHTKGPHGHR